MKAILCDFCKKEIEGADEHNKFILPFYKKFNAMKNGHKVATFKTGIEKREVDLCVDCMANLANLFDFNGIK